MTSMIGLRITYGPDNTCTLFGTNEQIERLMTLALDSARANVALVRPTIYVTQQELDDLRAIHKEWFGS